MNEVPSRSKVMRASTKRRHFLRQGGLAAAGLSLAVVANPPGQAGPGPGSPEASSRKMENQSWKRLQLIFPIVKEQVWDQRPSSPNLVVAGDRLLMFYHGEQYFDDKRKFRRIGLAEASRSDPLSWRKVSDQPLLDLGPAGSIDSHWVSYPWVVPITETHWHMYYAAWDGQFLPGDPNQKRYTTTMAESDDGGRSWKRSNRLLIQLARPGACDEHGSGSCAVLKVGDEYWMYYTAVSHPRPDWSRISVALAISRDGGHNFEPHPAGALVNVPPVIGSVYSTSSKPFVEHRDGLYRMWYSCARDKRGYRIHYAESPDGIYFKWLPDPVLDVSVSGWDDAMTCYPCIWHHGERTLMFYDGNNYAGIGVAELEET